MPGNLIPSQSQPQPPMFRPRADGGGGITGSLHEHQFILPGLHGKRPLPIAQFHREGRSLRHGDGKIQKALVRQWGIPFCRGIKGWRGNQPAGLQIPRGKLVSTIAPILILIFVHSQRHQPTRAAFYHVTPGHSFDRDHLFPACRDGFSGDEFKIQFALRQLLQRTLQIGTIRQEKAKLPLRCGWFAAFAEIHLHEEFTLEAHRF